MLAEAGGGSAGSGGEVNSEGRVETTVDRRGKRRGGMKEKEQSCRSLPPRIQKQINRAFTMRILS